MAKKTKNTKIETLTHDGSTRKNIPTAELEGLLRDEEAKPLKVNYKRRNNPKQNPTMYSRNHDIDPQLVWKGKDQEDMDSLKVDAVPIYVQEQIHPKIIIEDIKNHANKIKTQDYEDVPDLFADFAGELDPEDKIEFYQHAQKWTNRMILGDSLQVMASLSEKEGLKGQVQSVYIDPPYGINFGSNWQHTTKKEEVKDGAKRSETLEPEVIRAFRDTWQFGTNSYLSYFRDRLTIIRDLLTDSGSVFVQISAVNCHLLRNILDEVFGREQFISQITVAKVSTPSSTLDDNSFFVLWYAKDKKHVKIRQLYTDKPAEEWVTNTKGGSWGYSIDGIDKPFERGMKSNPSLIPEDAEIYALSPITSSGASSNPEPFRFEGEDIFPPANSHWKTAPEPGLQRALKAGRIEARRSKPWYKRYHSDNPYKRMTNIWLDTSGKQGQRFYVVQTEKAVIERCILMSSDPGDIVLDPTCGGGTTAISAEKWGRRWITIDTSRVSLAVSRSRLMGGVFESFILRDSEEGAELESQLFRTTVSGNGYSRQVNKGFVLKRFPKVTLENVAKNKDIDVIYEQYMKSLNVLKSSLTKVTGKDFEDWEIPVEAEKDWGTKASDLLREINELRSEKRRKMESSIRDSANIELLHDQPYISKSSIRVCGPFTVESLSPHRIFPTDAEDDAMLQKVQETNSEKGGTFTKQKSRRLRPKSIEEGEAKFLEIIHENLVQAGVQNTKKGERLEFTSLEPWLNGRHIQFEGRYMEKGREKKAAICIGPEFGTVTKSLMVQSAREAADYFDILIVLGFAFEAHADKEQLNIGRMPVIRARMNNDLHMADRLKSGKSGNLFVVFGEPDIELRMVNDDESVIEIKGVDIFDPTTGDVKASGPEDIACWFIDTDYNDEAFFVRHAYFSGGGPNPYDMLRSTMGNEIDKEAWEILFSSISRPFANPSTGRVAVKAINHYGDEVLKIFDVK